MQLFARIFIVTFGLLFTSPLLGAGDCDCPVIECNPCQEQVNIEFYSEKCSTGTKVKSCKRPLCEAKDPLPETCQAEQKAKPKDDSSRDVVATKPKSPPRLAGLIFTAVGEATVLRLNGEKLAAKPNVKLFEGDTIETKNGRVIVKLQNDNTISVIPDSKFVIETFEVDKSTHKTLLELMHGTIRSAVKKAPGNAVNDFKVKTRSAVAGVRGTDFVTTYTEKVNITKVETLSGLVELTSPSGKHNVAIPAGRYASYIVSSGSGGAIGDDDIAQYVERGYMTDTTALSKDEINQIEVETGDIKPGETQQIAAQIPVICSHPTAKMNQCAWSCVNNPLDSKRCRTDLPNVKCVRSRCNANGDWAEETRLPANASETCNGEKTIIEDCDY